MKRIFCLSIVFIALLVGYSQPAAAQFWKKWGKKEQRQKRKPVKKPVIKERPVAKPVKKKHEFNYPESQKKSRYRVDVLLPLYLDELVKGDKTTFKGRVPAKALPAMEFYEGLKLAADTLARFAYNIDIYIHDIAAAGATPPLLAKNTGLDTSDLIIGAVQSQYISLWAAFAREKHINFISSLSPSDADVKDNPYFILLQPTLQTHCEYIMKMVTKKYPKNDPLLFYRTSAAVDKNAYNYLLEANKDVRQFACNSLPAKQQLKPLLDSAGSNVIIMAFIDADYAGKVLQQLQDLFPEYRFDIYGMPSWTTMSSIKKAGAYPNMTIYVTDPFYFNSTTSWGQALASTYKKEYGGNPGELVYRGYEAFYWYAYLLNKYGNIFNEKLEDNGIAPFTRYDIKTRWNKDDELLYKENMHLYLYRYQDGSYMIEQ